MDTAKTTSEREVYERVAAVIPCYNAGTRLAPVVARMAAIVRRVVVVDDGSTDGAVSALSDPNLRVVQFEQNRGKGFALLAGFRVALEYPEVGCVAVCDADGQHSPEELPNLYEAFVESGADLVIGSRTFGAEYVPWRSRIGNTLTALLMAWLLGRWLPDTQSGYRLHSRRLLEDILTNLRGGRYETEMDVIIRAVRGGYRIVPAPISTIYETGNPSSHFNKVRDSFRIYRKLFAAGLRRR